MNDKPNSRLLCKMKQFCFAVCAGASQIALMADEKTRSQISQEEAESLFAVFA